MTDIEAKEIVEAILAQCDAPHWHKDRRYRIRDLAALLLRRYEAFGGKPKTDSVAVSTETGSTATSPHKATLPPSQEPEHDSQLHAGDVFTS